MDKLCITLLFPGNGRCHIDGRLKCRYDHAYLLHQSFIVRSIYAKENLSAKKTETSENARIPQPNEHQKRTQCSQATADKGKEKARALAHWDACKGESTVSVAGYSAGYAARGVALNALLPHPLRALAR